MQDLEVYIGVSLVVILMLIGKKYMFFSADKEDIDKK